MTEDATSFSLGRAVGAVVPAVERHLSVVPPLGAAVHDHTWALRDTEHDDRGLTINRFECDCGGVSYT